MKNFSIRAIILSTTCFISSFLSAQQEYCASIDKYDIHSKIEASHIAIVEVNETLLINIRWIGDTTVDKSFFGHTVFYSDAATFNDPENNQFRVTLIKPAKDCFHHIKFYRCNATLSSGLACRELSTSSSAKCWRH